jgi:hypothetical protein
LTKTERYQSAMTENTNANEGVKALLLGTTPERPDDIANLLANTQFERVSDRPALHLEAISISGKGLVVFTDRTMQQIWLIAYLSWQTLREQTGFILVPLRGGRPYETKLFERNDRYISRVNALDRALSELRTSPSGEITWPSDVPRLDPTLSQLRDAEDRAAYELGCFAASFVMLHETHHAMKRSASEDYGGMTEELACDMFAIRFQLENNDEYAKLRTYDPTAVYRKRSIGLLFGLAVAFESTELGLWLPSRTHPMAYDRIKQLVNFVEPEITSPDDDFWVIGCCMLLSKARRHNRLPDEIPFQSCRDLFYKVLALMRGT